MKRPSWRWILAASLLVCAAIYLCSGIRLINQDELGVIRRFGRINQRLIPPGICFRPPWPIEIVTPVRVTDVKTVAVGFDEIDELLDIAADEDDCRMLTGDTNLIQLQAWIHYQISDPIAMVSAVSNPTAYVRHSAESALALEVARMNVDDVLTSGRRQLEDAAQQRLQQLLEHPSVGLRVLSVKIKQVDPPQATQAAFNDVTSAKADQARLMHEAHEYRNSAIPRARGQAAEILAQAAAYAREQTGRAMGEASRFDALRLEFIKAPDITSCRLYWDTMARALRLCRIVTLPLADSNRITLRTLESRPDLQPSASDRTAVAGGATWTR